MPYVRETQPFQNLLSHRGQRREFQGDTHRVADSLAIPAALLPRCRVMPHWHQGDSSHCAVVVQQTHPSGGRARSAPMRHKQGRCP